LFPRLLPIDLSEQTGYVGVAALALALAGALLPPLGGAPRGFLAALALLGAALSVGDHTPLFGLLLRVPGFDSMRVPARHLFEWTFAAAALAGLGTDALLDRQRPAARRVARAAAAGLVLAALLVFSLVVLVHAFEPPIPKVLDRLSDIGLADATLAGRIPFFVA